MGVMIWEDFSWKRDTVLNWCERKYFEKEKRARKKQTNKQTFNATCYAVFRHLKSQLKELHVIFSCDVDDRKLFSKIPIIGFKNNKKLNHIS